ncbi:MAG: tyrosine-type recombinase/integrase [Candidatus Omnitrophota bacterium]
MINMKNIYESFEKDCEDKNRIFAIKTMLKHLCKAFDVEDISEIRSEKFWELGRVFKTYLRSPEVNLKKKSQREYRHRLHDLMKYAKQKGLYSYQAPDISEEWMGVVEKAKSIHKIAYWAAMKAGRFASSCGCRLEDCDEKFFEAYYQFLSGPECGIENPRRAYAYTKKVLKQFFEFPEDRFYQLPSKNNPSYRLAISEWPKSFAADFRRFEKWATSPYTKGRPKRCRQKQETWDNNLTRMERYIGFLTKIHGIPVFDIGWDTVLSYEKILAFIEYLDSQNSPNGHHQKSYIALFRNLAINFLPLGLNLQCGDAEAIDEILREYIATPRFRPADFADRYNEIVEIADEIRRCRIQLEKRDKKLKAAGKEGISQRTLALKFEHELLIRLALKRPLRSRNLREMEIGKNLIARNKKYFLRFEWDEFKRGECLEYVEFPFPASLVPMLEEYLEDWRPVLLNGGGCKNLFITREGTPFVQRGLRLIFLGWSERVHGKHLTTHHIRHIAATGYLKRHPGDFLTLQKMLMHKRLDTTLKIYSQFSETHACAHFDEFGDGVEAEVRAGKSAAADKPRRKRSVEKTETAAMRMVEEAMRA